MYLLPCPFLDLISKRKGTSTGAWGVMMMLVAVVVESRKSQCFPGSLNWGAWGAQAWNLPNPVGLIYILGMWLPPSFRTVNFQVVWGAGAITNRAGPGNAMTGQKKRRQRSFVNGAVTHLVQSYILNIFHFHLYLGKWSNLTNIFQMGWFNHQLVYLIYPPMKLTARPWKFMVGTWISLLAFGLLPGVNC